jgi:hypothetical protein
VCGAVIQTSHTPYRSGIDALRDAQQSSKPVPTCIAADEAVRNKYSHDKTIPLWKLVLLHSGVDPDWLGQDEIRRFQRHHRSGIHLGLQALLQTPPSQEDLLCGNVERVRRAVKDGEFQADLPFKMEDTLVWEVYVDQFWAWSARVELPVIGPWPTRDAATGEGVLLRFPSETLPLLQLRDVAWWLADQCADRAAGAVRPAWPPSSEIQAYAMRERGMSKRLACAMATIVRAGLPLGRRPK